MSLDVRPLGSTGRNVSVMALGSWRTFERIPRSQGIEVMKAARAAGVTMLDDARYTDETGTAPIPTGYSEVVFGELFRAAGFERDEVTVSNKLWWEFWPAEDAVAEVRGSLGRMGFASLDLLYAICPPSGLEVSTVVEQIGRVFDAGLARAWGTGMWSAAQHEEALDCCERLGVPGPVVAQMACSLVDHEAATSSEMTAAFTRGGIGLVAAYVLAGGALSGKYLSSHAGRVADDLSPAVVAAKIAAAGLVDLAAEVGATPSQLAFCYALAQPQLTSVLFGATTSDQVRENVGAVDVLASLTPSQLTRLHDLAR